jgi:RND family efflux transporter MFP subunit
MRSTPHFNAGLINKNKQYLTTSLLCLSLVLSACGQSEPPPKATSNQFNTIELIAEDLTTAKIGALSEKVAFTGTIRAVEQSSIQAQVSATATNVNAQVGDQVTKGQVLVRLNNQDNAARLAQARANLASAQAQANQAELMVQRKKRLLDQGFIAKVEYEQSQVDYRAQLENTHAMQANVDIAIKADQDGIIKSPINGVVTKRQVEPGQTVSIGQTLFEIINPNILEIQAKVPNDEQQLLQIGQAIEYRIQGNPNILNAKISRISPIADLNSRQIEFFATPSQTLNTLSIGAFVEGHLLGKSQNSGQIIPLNTIQNIDTTAYVWLVRAGKIMKQNIAVLQQDHNNNIAVVSGLEPNDQISRVALNDADQNKSVVISAPNTGK